MADEIQTPSRSSIAEEIVGEPCFADAGLPANQDDGPVFCQGFGERSPQIRAFGIAADERRLTHLARFVS